MDELLSNIKISVPEGIYLKDPESSDLGKRIVEQSIEMIDENGFETFTFKKLGLRLQSNESSIYRYFENKHKLLVYLTSWYWAWVEYQLVFETHNISNSEEKLKKAIDITTRTIKQDSNFSHVNEVALNRIIVNESSKSFLTKEVDEENKQGYFKIYKRLVARISQMIQGVNGDYAYPTSLASTVLEGSLHQHFLKLHFVSITDCSKKVSPTCFFTDLVFKAIQ